MKISQAYILILLISLLTSCELNKQLEGLWQIEKVSQGNKEMTPVAKWTRINKDKTQESGNGWNQHTTGSWEYDKTSNKIEISNNNGVKDEYGGFAILEIDNERMLWSRKEEEETVQVYLKKIKKIPKAPSNELLGIWKLILDGEDSPINSNPYLFFRWDNILINKNDQGERKFGMYKTHGHKNELQIIFYETPLREIKWNYRFNEVDFLLLEREENGKVIIQKYERINYIPS